MRKRVEAFVACLAFIFSVAAAVQARATFSSEEPAARAKSRAAVESPRQLNAPRVNVPKSPVDGRKKSPDGLLVFAAADERNFSVSTGILMTGDALVLARKLAALYNKMTGGKLHFTSGYRTPDRQALAMYQMIRAHGVSYYKRVYRRRPRPAGQILIAYLKHHGDRARAIGAMTVTIKSQIKNGVYISNHLREHALDVRSTARRGALEVAAGKLSGRVGREIDHYHVEL